MLGPLPTYLRHFLFIVYERSFSELTEPHPRAPRRSRLLPSKHCPVSLTKQLTKVSSRDPRSGRPRYHHFPLADFYDFGPFKHRPFSQRPFFKGRYKTRYASAKLLRNIYKYTLPTTLKCSVDLHCQLFLSSISFG
jgi:hypothetical protein